ncbi:MAG: hypothetical protein V7K21_14970 [Nostoc sp.]
MVITNFGSPEVFVESEVDKPTPKNNEVLIKRLQKLMVALSL